jgi:class 3 adenylate cyclase
LRELEEYIFTFLSIDIVGNSGLVRKYPDKMIQKTYSDLRKIVQDAVEKRNGRIWNWEGDGGLSAFYFSHKNNAASLSAMEIIHELFLYNLIRCRLDEPLRVRIAVHSGPSEFRYNFEDIKSDTIKNIEEIESKYTKPNSVTYSNNVYHMLDNILAEQLSPVKSDKDSSFFKYELKWEKSPDVSEVVK